MQEYTKILTRRRFCLYNPNRKLRCVHVFVIQKLYLFNKIEILDTVFIAMFSFVLRSSLYTAKNNVIISVTKILLNMYLNIQLFSG